MLRGDRKIKRAASAIAVIVELERVIYKCPVRLIKIDTKTADRYRDLTPPIDSIDKLWKATRIPEPWLPSSRTLRKIQ
jgi:hypothetical protein